MVTKVRQIHGLRAYPTVSTDEASRLAHLVWFATGCALGFLIPYIFTSVLDLSHDLYYLIYFGTVLVFLAAYTRATGADVIQFFRTSWRWSLAIGLLSTLFVIVNVVSRNSTDGPSGLYAVFEVMWRGLAYGTVDALLLSAFPGLVAFGLIGRDLSNLRRHCAFFAAALPLVVVITATYHLGYEQYREDGIIAPEIGNTVISVPMLTTGNPLGSLITHASMHATADIHSYETDVFLPPMTESPD